MSRRDHGTRQRQCSYSSQNCPSFSELQQVFPPLCLDRHPVVTNHTLTYPPVVSYAIVPHCHFDVGGKSSVLHQHFNVVTFRCTTCTARPGPQHRLLSSDS